VHVYRNPLDQIISAWTSRFAQGHHYALELYDLVNVQIAYQKLMKYWKTVIGNRVYQCSYEKLVLEPRIETKLLSEFCGLHWTEQMLRPQSSKRIVRTASFQQVRLGINTRSIGRWKNYEKQLIPFFNELKEEDIEIHY